MEENVDSVQDRTRYIISCFLAGQSILEILPFNYSKKRWTGPFTGRDTEVEVHVLDRELPLKFIIIIITHFIEHIIYSISSRLKKIICQKHILYCLVYTISRRLCPILSNFNCYQFKIQIMIR